MLAGGTGSRLRPLTTVISKHLLPVYNKPMIYYPLSTLLLAGIREILVVTNERDREDYIELLGDGRDLGCCFEYVVQNQAKGIPDALRLGEGFSNGEGIVLILGDNIFYGAGVGDSLRAYSNGVGATVFLQQVTNPEDYGVLEIGLDGQPLRIVEKPANPASNLAVTGLYFYDSTVFERVRNLKPSSRGELEISDLNNSYLRENNLNVVKLPRGTAWFDAGSMEALFLASEFVRVLESRQDFIISSPEEVALSLGYVDQPTLMTRIAKFSESSYGKRLTKRLFL